MFAFLKKKKIKKSTASSQQAGVSDDKENSVSLPATGPAPNDKQDSAEKLLLLYDSSESSPRELSNGSPHKSCATHTPGTATPSHIGTSDLHRILTSGYLNDEKNMGYMKRSGAEQLVSSPKSPQFHRPVGFSYNRTNTFTVPGPKKGMKALVTGQTRVRKVHCSHSQPATPCISVAADPEVTVEKEPIVLSRYSGGFIPDPLAPKKIESLDWPAPIAMQAVPDLMRSHRSRSESRSNPTDVIPTITTLNNDMSISNDSSEGDELRHDDQLDKDISEMSKLKESSGMAHALLENLRIQEKFISRQLPLDPWKASRSPSAALEPPRRCRFESPKFASPSRRVYTHSSSTTTQDESLGNLSTTGKQLSLARYQQQALGNDSVLKVQTLSHRRDIQRSCDLDSTIISLDSNDVDQHKSAKTVDVDGRYPQSCRTSHHAPSTHSAPALISNPKIYPYDELKVMRNKRLPSDVDRDHLERHLSDDEFRRLFQMNRSDFYRLSEWRRVDLKKRFKIF